MTAVPASQNVSYPKMSEAEHRVNGRKPLQVPKNNLQHHLDLLQKTSLSVRQPTGAPSVYPKLDIPSSSSSAELVTNAFSAANSSIKSLREFQQLRRRISQRSKSSSIFLSENLPPPPPISAPAQEFSPKTKQLMPPTHDMTIPLRDSSVKTQISNGSRWVSDSAFKKENLVQKQVTIVADDSPIRARDSGGSQEEETSLLNAVLVGSVGQSCNIPRTPGVGHAAWAEAGRASLGPAKPCDDGLAKLKESIAMTRRSLEEVNRAISNAFDDGEIDDENMQKRTRLEKKLAAQCRLLKCRNQASEQTSNPSVSKGVGAQTSPLSLSSMTPSTTRGTSCSQGPGDSFDPIDITSPPVASVSRPKVHSSALPVSGMSNPELDHASGGFSSPNSIPPSMAGFPSFPTSTNAMPDTAAAFEVDTRFSETFTAVSDSSARPSVYNQQNPGHSSLQTISSYDSTHFNETSSSARTDYASLVTGPDLGEADWQLPQGGVAADRGGSDSTYAVNASNPRCPEHNEPTAKLTVRRADSANIGRRFYACARRDDGCGFLKWADDEDCEVVSAGSAWGDSSEVSNRSMALAGSQVQSLFGQGLRSIDRVNKDVFGHGTFRPGQREVVQAALEGKDVIVIMPTGGGKSLCYQLPACAGPGLTVVISPLLSLIQDQVLQLHEMGVPAESLTSAQNYEETQMQIYNQLMSSRCTLKLLYVTPEKVIKSPKFTNILRFLYNNKRLDRFVVDEAHCISQWGHDFRPDYMGLSCLRNIYPTVPIMALTATASPRIRANIASAMKMSLPFLLEQSFNRPNLRYEVRRKSANYKKDIANYIIDRLDDSGIIYCLSRAECETLAAFVQEAALEALKTRTGRGRRRYNLNQYSTLIEYYHASREDRESVHERWSKGQTKVVVATVAFGMGINKPDVRYVIHNTMPQSVTHYYQESGRAGRDGQIADCILYYSTKDKNRVKRVIQMEENTSYQNVHIHNLYKMVNFCENEVECRRVLVLEYFGEHFNRDKCRGTCDNCRERGGEPQTHDVTQDCRDILNVVDKVTSAMMTATQLINICRGVKDKSQKKFNVDVTKLPEFGRAKRWSKFELERILNQMIMRRYLAETEVKNGMGFANTFLHRGATAERLRSGQDRQIQIQTRTKKGKATKDTSKLASKTKKKSTVGAKAGPAKIAVQVEPLREASELANRASSPPSAFTAPPLSYNESSPTLSSPSKTPRRSQLVHDERAISTLSSASTTQSLLASSSSAVDLASASSHPATSRGRPRARARKSSYLDFEDISDGEMSDDFEVPLRREALQGESSLSPSPDTESSGGSSAGGAGAARKGSSATSPYFTCAYECAYRIAPAATEQLLQLLKDWRQEVASKRNLATASVLPLESLVLLSRQAPTTVEELAEIEGMAMNKRGMYGEAIVRVIGAFLEDNEIIPAGEVRRKAGGKNLQESNVLKAGVQSFRENPAEPDVGPEGRPDGGSEWMSARTKRQRTIPNSFAQHKDTPADGGGTVGSGPGHQRAHAYGPSSSAPDGSKHNAVIVLDDSDWPAETVTGQAQVGLRTSPPRASRAAAQAGHAEDVSHFDDEFADFNYDALPL